MKTKHKIIYADARKMPKVKPESVDLIVTSPPYPMISMWDTMFSQMDPKIETCLKKEDGNAAYKLMHAQLNKIWRKSSKALKKGGLACINIGDALRKIDDNFQLYPNHIKVIEHCEALGFTTLPYILWKKPTKRANAFLGSGFIPPNAYVTQDCEFILLFRKGQPRPFPPKDLIRYASHYTISERNAWFTQIWQLPGARQRNRHISRRVAAFPEEIAYRLIRMFSVIGDTIVDPFVGTGTTMKVAKDIHRNSVGYEIDKRLVPVIEQRIGNLDALKPRRKRKVIEGFHISHQVERD